MNKNLFSSQAPLATNASGTKAYANSDKHSLAQYAATGCLGSTFYASDAEQLNKILELANKVDPAFLAKVAIYSRKRGNMKDVPALLVAMLSQIAAKDKSASYAFNTAFQYTIDDGKMLRNIVQIVRSGKVGRKSLGYSLRKKISRLLDSWTPERIFKNSIGSDPSLGDVVKLSHPKPKTPEHEAMYGWLIDSEKHNRSLLPEGLKAYNAWRENPTTELPDVPFLMLTSVENLPKEVWAAIALKATWTQCRMNLNTFTRHGAFEVDGVAEAVATKLRDPIEVEKSKVFPYQLMVAWMFANETAPSIVSLALQEAMEHAIKNVPAVGGQILIAPDISGSMSNPVTGDRGSASTKVSCRNVASLISAAFVRRNTSTRVFPFSDRVDEVKLNPLDSVMTNTNKINSLPSGGTNCSLPLAEYNRLGIKADLVIYVSDNESWLDSNYYGRPTGLMSEWATFKRNNPKAKLVCIDLTPNTTSQVKEGVDRLNIGGFSDAVFDVIDLFAKGELGTDHWVGEIDNIGQTLTPVL